MEGTETAREVRRWRGSSDTKKPRGEDGEETMQVELVVKDDARNEIPEKRRESEMRRRKTC